MFNTRRTLQGLIFMKVDLAAMTCEDQNNLYAGSKTTDGNNRITKYLVKRPAEN